ncbi:hypothetical protein FSP39_010350 [Pinctada imbricata]|uniref:Uncharacterized protein n=1 Tax=Pinctada imbricata TaxID=66713 RepID=A0AA89C1B3_PINIB|nr:hypothetical protein FSP39_010350 [Pinctada imbricata]
MLMELVIKFRETDHLDDLNDFVENEKIQTLSLDDLKKRLDKSLAINVETLEKVFNEELERKSLIMIASLAIEIANKVPSTTTTPKRKLNEATTSSTKKQKDDIDDDKDRLDKRLVHDWEVSENFKPGDFIP